MATTEGGISQAQKAIERLSASIDSGDLYQALQLFKTQHARAKKKGDLAQATELAFRGANLMLDKKEVNAGSELARDFIELLKAQSEFNYDKVLSELLILDGQFSKLEGEEATRERKRFLKAAIDFTAEKGPWVSGDPELHRVASLAALKEQDIMVATKHQLHAHRPEEYANLLVKWAKLGPESERDLYLARAVLQLLCLENLRDANAVNKAFRAEFPDLDTPLLRYIGYLLRTLERDAYPLFQVLRQKYGPSIARGNTPTSSFDAYLDKIASVFYGVAPPKSGMASMMESLMKGLF
jgi:hypothetical protein